MLKHFALPIGSAKGSRKASSPLTPYPYLLQRSTHELRTGNRRQPRKPAPGRHRPRLARRGPRQGHAAPRRGRPRARGATAHRRIPRLREIHPGPPLLGSAGDGAAPVRHLPGEPPPGRRQGPRPGGRRPDHHPHRREDPAADALRAGPPVPRAALLPPLVARPAVRLRIAGAAAQHRRRRRSLPGGRPARRAAAQVWPGGDPHHRRQARARHRGDPWRGQ